MSKNNWLSSVSILMGALAFSTLPVWAQVASPQGEKSTGSAAVGQGQSGAKEGQAQGQAGMKQGQSGVEQGQAAGTSRTAGGTAASNEDIKKVQQALKEKGQDPGAIDGVMGPKTREALRAFQQQQGLSATGTLDDQTKAALGIEGKSSKSAGSSKSTSRSGSGAAGSGMGGSARGDSGSESSRGSGGSEGPADKR
jgi:peptidoglycan hydrolase-like protein with peptidoglycan-binding domain